MSGRMDCHCFLTYNWSRMQNVLSYTIQLLYVYNLKPTVTNLGSFVQTFYYMQDVIHCVDHTIHIPCGKIVETHVYTARMWFACETYMLFQMHMLTKLFACESLMLIMWTSCWITHYDMWNDVDTFIPKITLFYNIDLYWNAVGLLAPYKIINGMF